MFHVKHGKRGYEMEIRIEKRTVKNGTRKYYVLVVTDNGKDFYFFPDFCKRSQKKDDK